MKIQNEKDISNPAQPFQTPALLTIGIVSVAVAFLSSRLDGLMFYLLASGSIVFAILIASAVLDMILTGIAWMCGRQRERASAAEDVSCTSFQGRTSGSREIAIVKPVS